MISTHHGVSSRDVAKNATTSATPNMSRTV